MFKSLFKAVVGTALLPIDIVADVVTLGGVSTNRDATYTGERLRTVAKNLTDATTPENP